MALPECATTGEKVWYVAFRVICAAIFLFLIGPLLVIIPLSFNAEPYFTFTPEMLSFDPEAFPFDGMTISLPQTPGKKR